MNIVDALLTAAYGALVILSYHAALGAVRTLRTTSSLRPSWDYQDMMLWDYAPEYYPRFDSAWVRWKRLAVYVGVLAVLSTMRGVLIAISAIDRNTGMLWGVYSDEVVGFVHNMGISAAILVVATYFGIFRHPWALAAKRRERQQ